MKGQLDFIIELRRRINAYLHTAYRTNSPEFDQAREDLISDLKVGPILREERYEALTRYQRTSLSAEQLIANQGFQGADKTKLTLVADFLKTIGPVKEQALFNHQVQSIDSVLSQKRHIVVTTGTGSGKSYCFVLPLLLNLIKEALGTGGRKPWSGPSLRTPYNWWQAARSAYKSKRVASARKSAVRALIMYPLNALVQDQVESLRGILHSDEAENLFKNAFNGDRIYFGQYSGSTPGSGDRTSSRSLDRCRNEFSRIEREAGDILNADNTIQRIEGSELLSRWDMQDFPPDILITNYSMLSVMMVRTAESNIFSSTKAWIDESEDNIFYLVLDELHSYRGTGGTEISYIVKTFLDRIGLHAGHPQLRLICTSASLEDSSGGEGDPKFLADFFGLDQNESRFNIINGDIDSRTPCAASTISSLKSQLISFNENPTSQLFEEIADDLKKKLNFKPSLSSTEVLEQSGLHDSLISLSDSIRQTDHSSQGLGAYALSVSEIAEAFFGMSEDAARGYLRLLSSDLLEPRTYTGKLRQHVFVRNLDGIRRSMAISNSTLVAPILYDTSARLCSEKNAITLDCSYCQECGELYYSGFLIRSQGQTGVENHCVSNEPAFGTNSSERLLIHFPREEAVYNYDDEWAERYFHGISGRLVSNPTLSKDPSWARVSVFGPISIESEDDDWLPTTCPHCEANWTSQPEKSPIREMGTGYGKFSQLIVEQIFDALKASAQQNPKLVAFSDSRKDAAVLSADLELNHYNDSVRAIGESVLQTYSGPDGELLDFVQRCKSMSTSELLGHPYMKKHQTEATLVWRLQTDQLSEGSPEIRQARVIMKQTERNWLPFRSENEGSLVRRVLHELVTRGFNPAGLYKNASFRWQDLFLGNAETFDETRMQDRTLAQTAYIVRLSKNLREIVAASRGRDFESLGFGWITFDRMTTKEISERETKLLDSVIRFLVYHYKTRQDEQNNYSGFENGLLPIYFTKWISSGFWGLYSHLGQREISADLLGKLTELNVTTDRFQIRLDNIFVHKAGEVYWRCEKCAAIHLFDGDQRCRRIRSRGPSCTGKLAQRPIAELLSRPNYYREYGSLGRSDAPLRTEELVGHTDKSEQRKRQLAFKGKFTRDIATGRTTDWIEKFYGINCLSVTTTMEAGVDIGGLRAVFMANMPPKRFNYQQRVGRAGRRNDRIATAVTFCKGQKHDEYYFENQILMIGEKTTSPSLDQKNDRILSRVLLRESLWRMRNRNPELADTIFDSIEGDQNNGQFGTLGDYRIRSDEVIRQFDQIAAEILQYANTIRPNYDNTACLRDVREMLLQIRSNVDQLILKYSPNYSFTEAVSLEGYLPLYGLPVRDSAFIHAEPNSRPNRGEFPIRYGMINRNEDYALSEYAPERNVIKDKRVMKAVGIGWPQLDSTGRRNFISFGDPVLPRDFTECRTCGALFQNHTINSCTDCGAIEANLRRFIGWRPSAYVADFRAEKDYDGRVPNERIQVTVYPTSLAANNGFQVSSTANATMASFPGQILRLNSNSGQGYSFTRVRADQEMPGAYIETESLPTSHVMDWRDLTTDTPVTGVALFSEQRSDILICTVNDVDQNSLKVSSEYLNDPAVISAWESVAEILGRTITLIEDIEPSELAVGKKIWRRNTQDGDQTTNWSTFIIDSLDNGAGYSSKYSVPANFQRLLEIAESRTVASMLEDGHAHVCSSSCYKCLRSYYNRFQHKNLDWRLGYDLLRLLKDPRAEISIKNAWWDRLVYHSLFAQLNEISGRQFSVRQTSAGKVFLKTGLALLPIHPLQIEHFSLHLTKQQISQELGGVKVNILDVLSFERSPLAELMKKLD